MRSLEGKRIVYCVSGGIASVKAPLVLRELLRRGASVRVVASDTAKQFVATYPLEIFSGVPVVTSLFPERHAPGALATWHVDYARWADAVLIAPATATTLARIAGGLSDSPVALVVSSLKNKPLVLAPAMDEEMWLHPQVKENIAKLSSRGTFIINPETGALASGLEGEGRMLEPTALCDEFEYYLSAKPLRGKRIVVTAGPTYEAIDPVRFIGNASSGKMGIAIAEEASKRGAAVTLIVGPVSQPTDRRVERIDVVSAEDMRAATLDFAPTADIVILSAAVADYRPIARAQKKLKKEILGARPLLQLERTPDIALALASIKPRPFLLVGFALETEYHRENAIAKLHEKNFDMIVVNDAAALGAEKNRITIIDSSGNECAYPETSKYECAQFLLIQISEYLSRHHA